MTVYWWVCTYHGCLDMMARSPDPEQVARDRDAHLTRHPDWTPTELQLRLSHWPQ